ncbi:MAG: helical backbone metal receptor, partial [Planctomycetota bacterium]
MTPPDRNDPARLPRYVSLVPSLTETLFALGVGAQVVGATKFCVHPREGADHLVRVGGTKDPRVDRIVSLRPTCVFVNEEENRREDVEALREAGVHVHVTFPRRVADVAPMIEEVAGVVGRREKGSELARELEQASADLDRLRRRSSGVGAPDRVAPRFLVLVWRNPWIAAGSDTFLS